MRETLRNAITLCWIGHTCPVTGGACSKSLSVPWPRSGCSQAGWVEVIAAVYGLSGRYALRARDIRECDPMRSRSWFDESRAFKWAGDAAEALKIAREGNEVAPGRYFESWPHTAHWLPMVCMRKQIPRLPPICNLKKMFCGPEF